MRSAPVFLGLCLVGGCSSEKRPERPKPVRAGGVVRFNGQPLEGALVTFTQTGTQVAASGRTDAEGKFTLTTFEPGDGAVPGKHQVAVSKVQAVGAAASTDRAAREKSAPVWRASAPPEWRWLIPKRYGNPDTSGLTAEVPENGTTEIHLELQGSAR